MILPTLRGYQPHLVAPVLRPICKRCGKPWAIYERIGAKAQRWFPMACPGCGRRVVVEEEATTMIQDRPISSRVQRPEDVPEGYPRRIPGVPGLLWHPEDDTTFNGPPWEPATVPCASWGVPYWARG